MTGGEAGRYSSLWRVRDIPAFNTICSARLPSLLGDGQGILDLGVVGGKSAP
jgi:hypothetical protein